MDYIQLLGRAKRAFETFHREYNPFFIYPSVFKRLQSLLVQCNKPASSSIASSARTVSSTAAPAPIVDKGKGVAMKVLLSQICSLEPVPNLSSSFQRPKASPVPSLDGDSEDEHEVKIIMHAPLNNIATDLFPQAHVSFSLSVPLGWLLTFSI